MPQPAQMLPETQPGTMTWLVNRYLAAPTRLTLRHADGRLAGELTDDAGHPLAGVPVTLSAELLGEWGNPAVHTRSGRVPAQAVAAVLALRINVECGCSGPADIGIGLMRYHDDRTRPDGAAGVPVAHRARRPRRTGPLPGPARTGDHPEHAALSGHCG